MLALVFYLFATITIISAGMVVFLNNPIRCALFLVLAFITSAVLWMLMQSEFLALILILVYVGAVMTLFLFVIMMLDLEVQKNRFVRYFPISLIIVALLVTGLILGMQSLDLPSSNISENYNATRAIGLVLYTHYTYAFELAAVLLLIAIISSIVLVHRQLYPLNNAKRQ